jgi:alkylation response protein AidB-like acyl-CoA dehydrogenase
VPKENILGQLDKGWDVAKRVIARATVAKCCEMVGNLQQMLDMTVSYAKERIQFEHPIGTLQIIQHYCSDMLTDVQGARFSTYQAAWRLTEGLPCTKEIAVAKSWAGQAFERVNVLSHQIHGAIGFTMDHDLHFYTMRGKAAVATFGDADFYREVVAQEMGL